MYWMKAQTATHNRSGRSKAVPERFMLDFGAWQMVCCPRLGGERQKRRNPATPGRRSEERNWNRPVERHARRCRLRRRIAPGRHRALAQLPGQGDEGEL